MRKILGYEFKKLFSNKSVISSIIILIIISILGFYNNQIKYNDILIDNLDRYYELEEQYKNNLEGLKELEEELINYTSIYYMYIENDNNYMVIDDEEKEIIEKFNKSIYSNDINKLNLDLYLIEILSDQINHVNTYKDYLKSVEEDKDKLLKVSIFHKKGSFSYNNIIKTAEDFQKLNSVETSVGIEKGVTAISNYWISDLSILLIIIILSINIFLQERENEILNLLKANKKGRQPLIITKLITMILSVITITAFVYFSLMIISDKLYGFGDINRSIQSISNFRECNLLISVKEYLVLFIIFKIFTSIMISVIVTMIIQLNKNVTKSYIAVVTFIFLSYMFYKFIPFNSALNALKYINIFSFLSVGKLVGEYININFFTKAINLFSIYKIMLATVLPTFIGINILIFIKEKDIKGKEFNLNIFLKLKSKISRMTIPSTLFFNEIYKIIIENKAYVVILIAVFISISNININEERSYDNDTIIYKNYINKLSGVLTQGKEKYLEREQQKLYSIGDQKLKNEYLLKNNKITRDQYEKNLIKLEVLNKKVEAFDEVYNQYQYLKYIRDRKNINVHFIDKNIKEELFNLKSELNNGIYLSILLIIILSNIFAKEYKSGAIILIQGSKERKKLFLYKFIISYIITVILLILVYMPTYINVIDEFGIEFLKAPIQSMEQYMNISANLTIIQFIILESILKCIGVICITTCIVCLSLLSKNHITTIIISTILLIPSILMRLIGINLNENISISNIFSLNESLSYKSGISFNIIYFISIIILVVGIVFVTQKKFKNEKLLRRGVQA